MKNYLLLFGFLLSSIAAFAQAPYLGGIADGYATIEGQVGLIVAPPQPNVLVYPTVIQQGKPVNIALYALQKEYAWRFVDALGQIILEEKQTATVGRKEIQIVTDKIAAGIYLLEIIYDQEISSHKIIILNE